MRDNNTYLTETDSFYTYDNKYNLSINDYRLILRVFFTLFIEELVHSGNIFILPCRLGNLSIRKKETFGRGNFDYQLYKTTGVKK